MFLIFHSLNFQSFHSSAFIRLLLFSPHLSFLLSTMFFSSLFLILLVSHFFLSFLTSQMICILKPNGEHNLAHIYFYMLLGRWGGGAGGFCRGESGLAGKEGGLGAVSQCSINQKEWHSCRPWQPSCLFSSSFIPLKQDNFSDGEGDDRTRETKIGGRGDWANFINQASQINCYEVSPINSPFGFNNLGGRLNNLCRDLSFIEGAAERGRDREGERCSDTNSFSADSPSPHDSYEIQLSVRSA